LGGTLEGQPLVNEDKQEQASDAYDERRIQPRTRK
jgi:hypothetical protein